MASGRPTKNRRMKKSGATSRYDVACERNDIDAGWRSGRDELVPLPDHVGVLVHHRVPAGDVARALRDRAAVTRGAGLVHERAVRVLDVAGRRLALVPVVPLVIAHELARRLRHRAVVALLGDEPALPAGEVPVQVLVRRVQLEPREVLHQAEPGGPGAVALLERLVGAGNVTRLHGGDG